MNYQQPQLLDELAAHYALGTLRGQARARFERLCKTHRAAQHAVHYWEDRLVNMAHAIEPVKPSANVWREVQRRLGHGQRAANSDWLQKLFGWSTRPPFAMAMSLVFVMFAIAITTFVSWPENKVIATFASAQQTEMWRIEARANREELVVTGAQTLALDPNRDYELWALPDSGAAPVSLGLMPKNGKRGLALTLAQRKALAGSSKIAISLEPIGGSTTGAPTGPVLFVTAVSRA